MAHAHGRLSSNAGGRHWLASSSLIPLCINLCPARTHAAQRRMHARPHKRQQGAWCHSPSSCIWVSIEPRSSWGMQYSWRTTPCASPAHCCACASAAARAGGARRGAVGEALMCSNASAAGLSKCRKVWGGGAQEAGGHENGGGAAAETLPAHLSTLKAAEPHGCGPPAHLQHATLP